MTDDLVARLRQLAGNTGKMTWVGGSPITATDVLTQAADRIEALTAEIERLRERLEVDPSHPYDGIYARDETIRGLDAKVERDQAVEALRLFVGLMNDPDYDLGELCEEFCKKTESILASIGEKAMSECARCNGWGVDDVTGFACPSCSTVKQSLTVEPVSNPDELGAAIDLPAQREAAARAALEAAERELAMTCLANSEAPSEWIDGFEHAGKRLRAIDPAAFRGDDHATGD